MSIRRLHKARWLLAGLTAAGAPSHPNLYTAVKFSKTELRYGGPGAC